LNARERGDRVEGVEVIRAPLRGALDTDEDLIARAERAHEFVGALPPDGDRGDGVGEQHATNKGEERFDILWSVHVGLLEEHARRFDLTTVAFSRDLGVRDCAVQGTPGLATMARIESSVCLRNEVWKGVRFTPAS
jgi:hypothetical protein